MDFQENSTVPTHNQTRFISQTVDWYGFDNVELFTENYLKNRRRLVDLGWDQPGCIKYKFNSHGFRCEEFDDRPSGIAIGCSHSMGLGVNVENTWVHELSSMLGIHLWNLSVGGAGLDCNFRILDYYLDVLNPKFVVHLQPVPYRIEYYHYDNWVTVLGNAMTPGNGFLSFFKNWFSNDFISHTQARKNILAIKYLCKEKGIPYFTTSILDHSDFLDGKGRDLMHPGIDSHKQFANYMYSNKENYLG